MQYLGVYCPGCGSLRATHRVLTGRVGEALQYNVLLVCLGIPLAAWFWAEQVAMLVAGLRFQSVVKKAWVAWVLLFVLMVFTILRNLPGEAFAWLRPPS